VGFGETLVAIVLILALAVRSMVKLDQRGERQRAIAAHAVDETEFRALKDRVAVLERLVTDEPRRLDHEIERLRDHA